MTAPSDPRLYDPGPPPIGGAGVAGWVLVSALAAAPGARLVLTALGDGSPPAGALVAAVGFAAATLIAAWSLRRQLRARAPWWIAVMIAPTTLGAAVHEGRLEVLWMATTALALGLIFRTEHVGADRLGEVYGGDDRGGRQRWLRWLIVGALLAAPLALRPALLPLFAAGVAAAPPKEGWSGRGAVALGGALGVALGLALAGPAAWEGLELNTDLGLLWWSAVDLAAGRHIGIAVVFFPVLLAILAAERERVRQLLLAGALLSLVFDLLVHPFDQWGGSEGTEKITNFSFVPLLPVFWFLTTRPRHHNAPLTLAGVAVAGVMLCGPLWLTAWLGASPPEDPGPLLGTAERVRRRLPVETTQRSLQPYLDADAVSGELFLRRMDLGRGAPWTLRPESPVTLLAASPNELPAVIVEVEADGPSQLEARGAEVVQMAFRPDGGSAFQLSPTPRRRHRGWWSIAPQHFYVLRLVGFGEEAEPAGFSLHSGELVPGRP